MGVEMLFWAPHAPRPERRGRQPLVRSRGQFQAEGRANRPGGRSGQCAFTSLRAWATVLGAEPDQITVGRVGGDTMVGLGFYSESHGNPSEGFEPGVTTIYVTLYKCASVIGVLSDFLFHS